MSEVLPPVPLQEVARVEQMQQACIESYLAVAQSLQAGMNEQQIADAIRGQLAKKGVEEFWYNIPIMVLVGADRFKDMTLTDYAAKSPRENVVLQEGDVFLIDMHPRDEKTQRWGNFAATGIFRPREDQLEDISYLQEVQVLQEDGIPHVHASQTGAEVSAYYGKKMRAAGIVNQDVRGNVGHRMLSGQKNWEGIPYPFLDADYKTLLSGQIVGIEVGGIRERNGKPGLVARFEDCVHIPQNGNARILGRREKVPIIFGK